MRLLVVEDEDLLRARLVKALEDNAYVVDSTDTTPPSLILGCPNSTACH
jgi:DNA-binding response OmpR family regulator